MLVNREGSVKCAPGWGRPLSPGAWQALGPPSLLFLRAPSKDQSRAARAPSSEARPHIPEGLAQEASCVPRELPPLTPKAATGPQRPAPGVWVSAARYVQISSRIALLA